MNSRNKRAQSFALHVIMVILVIFATVFLTAAAPVQGETPPPESGEVQPGPSVPISDTSPEALAFIAYVITITAFFQKRLNLSGYPLMIAGAIVAAIIWFAPQFGDTVPAVKKWVDSGTVFIKLLLAAFGSVDFGVYVGARIATAKMTESGKITVGTTNK